MSRRLISVLMACILCLVPLSINAAESFSSNPDAIEEAAKSVLMLEVYDENNDVIATGSGFVAFNDRTLVTNYHVIQDGTRVIANSDEGYRYEVSKIFIIDEEKDIAICGFESSTGLKPLELNTDKELKRAENIVAIGSPIGITNTVSLGNISALYKDEFVSWIQFTAPISSGSSGGALFDDEGRVIGVTSATYNDTQNLNLAIHVSEVLSVYNSWNGEEDSLKGYMQNDINQDKQLSLMEIVSEMMRREWAEQNPTPKPTPKPTASPTSKPTPKPTVTPLFKITATPTPKPTTDLSIWKFYPTLEKGSQGEEVKKLQSALIELGYLKGSADGIFGSQTKLAVVRFNYQNFSYFDGTASNQMQRKLYGGAPKYKEPDIALHILNGAYAGWNYLDNDRLEIRFEVTNISQSRTVKAFELYVYAEDVWGDKIYGEDMVYYGTTTKNVGPGETVYSDYMRISDRSQISKVYCGINKIAYTDGSIKNMDKVEYACWEID